MRVIPWAMACAMIVVVSSGCAQFSHGYMSPEAKLENGRRLLEEALQTSDVLSVRSEGGVNVETDLELGPDSYCATIIASRGFGRFDDYWRNYDTEPGRETLRRCGGSYHGIVSVKPRDMRNCDGAECLWVRGF